MIIRGEVSELFDQYLSKQNVALFSHANNAMDPLRSVTEEMEHLLKRSMKGKSEDDSEKIKIQYEAYKAEGFPDSEELATTMVLLRRHNEPDVMKTMELWWEQIARFSRRDQMSFNYVAWKTGLRFAYIPGDSRDNKYFKWMPHENIPWLIRKWHKIQKWFQS
jgi:hypothetical protein